jgi:hypothetical protein
MTQPDLTLPEFRLLLAAQVALLDQPSRASFERHVVEPTQASSDHGRVWIAARAGAAVLGYDETEEEWGTGRVDTLGRIGDWGTWGDQLRWALSRFP